MVRSACIAFLMVGMPHLSLGLLTRSEKNSPYDTALVSTFQGPDMIPLYPKGQVPGQIPQAEAVGPAKDTVVSADGQCRIDYTQGNIFLVQEPALKPKLLNPSDWRRKTDAALIVVPGGYMASLAWEREGTDVADWLNSIGMNAFVLKYRVPSTDSNMAWMDAQRAISFVRSHAEEYGIDPSKIGIIGFNAGGSLATTVSLSKPRKATMEGYANIDDVDDFSHRPDFAMVIYGPGPQSFSLMDVHIQRPPPTFSVSAADDTCVSVEKATGYCDAVRRDGWQECTRFVYENGGHGFGTCGVYTNKWSGDAVCQWTKDAKEWLIKRGLLAE